MSTITSPGRENAGTLEDALSLLASAEDCDEVMQIVRTAARRLTGADGASFILREGDCCHYADEDAISLLWKGKRFPMEKCISGWAMIHQQPVIIDDIYGDPRVLWEAYHPTFIKSLAIAPVRRDSPIGAIGIYWASRHKATLEEMNILMALADGTGQALARAAAM